MLAAIPLLLACVVGEVPPESDVLPAVQPPPADPAAEPAADPAADPAVVPPATVTPPGAPTPRGRMVKRSLASTLWPVEPAFNGGFVVSRDSFAPFVGVTVFVPVWPGVGPTLLVRGSGLQTGDLSVGEAVVAVGPSLESNLGGLRARATLAPGVLVSGFSYDDGDDGASLSPALLVPLEVGLPLGGGVSFNMTIEGGLSRAISHVVNGEVAYARERAFVFVGAGLNFGGPPD